MAYHSRARKHLPVNDTGTSGGTSYAQPDPHEEPVDAEWEETNMNDHGQHSSGRQQQQGQRYSWKQQWEKARGFFATRAGDRKDRYQQGRAHWVEEMNASDDLSNRDELKLLRSNIADAGTQYMDSLRASNILAAGFNDDDRHQKTSALHDVHARMMMTSCMRPLQQGVSAASVTRAASMMATMYMLSPTFRSAVGEYAKSVGEAIQERVEAKADKKMGRAEFEAGRKNERIDGQNAQRSAEGKTEKRQVDPREKVGNKWQKRFDDMRFRQRGHREMYTPRSAAMTEVALAEQAFMKLREPDADTGQINDSYQNMVKHLYQQAEADGLNREEVAEASRVVLGERITEDPRMQTIAEGLSHGRDRMCAPRDERLNGTGTTVKVWHGQFEDYLGHETEHTRYKDPDTKDEVLGAFTVRGSMGADHHRMAMSETMTMTMSQAISDGDEQAFNEDLAGYMLGYSARARDFDGEDLPGAIPDRLFQSRTMLASMTADGFTDEQQQQTYSNAYVDAIEAMREKYPDFSRQWGQKYGEDWHDFMANATMDPAAAYQTWQTRERSGFYGASGTPRARPQPAASEQEPQPEYQP
ncbi:hypothetical protein [Arthrobacter castelli]|uniref:hypothetical protein n=1 Tax=Arthrobacter castelli TaxID=271431 RepID=UPI0003F9F592|nr:hypothetical protein [Arthrobacter castelli]